MAHMLDGFGASPVWSVQGAEKSKYESIFESLGPVAGKLAGEKVRPVLLNSKLPMDVLGRVWELSDIDKDGYLDKEEFCVAMHLVYRAIDKEPVPLTLPPNIVPPSKRGTSQPTTSSVPSTSSTNRHLPGAVAVLPQMPSSPAALKRHDSTATGHSTTSPQHSIIPSPPSQWVIGATDRARFNGIFQKSKDPDNFISGAAARNVFVQSGLPQNLLAHVWTMCDQQSTGRLSQDQFVMAMHLISQKVKGIDLPSKITPEMLLASSHDSGFGDTGSDSSSGVGDTAAMRELDALNQEIEELRKEKESLTSEIQLKEHTIRNTDHDVQELQDKLDRDSSSLAQLECDKAEAHTRLEELEQQRNKLDSMLADVRAKVQEENETIKSLRAQISAQEASVGQQEAELRRVRNELSELKKEETQFEQRLEAERQQHQTVERSVKETQAEIDKVKKQLDSLQGQRRSVSSNIEQYDKAAAAIKNESKDDLTFEPHDVNITVSDNVFNSGGVHRKDFHKEDFFNQSDDPFKNSDPFVTGSDPFEGADPFLSHAPASAISADPFSSDPLAATTADPFSSDPLAATTADPFSSDPPAATTADPFSSDPPAATVMDPFSSDPSDATTADPFAGTDPFKPPVLETSSANDPFQTSDSAFGFPTDQFPAATFAGQDPFTSNKSSAFATDPFATSDAFSSNKITFDAPATTASSASVQTDAFAKAFSDTEPSKESSGLFSDLEAFPASEQKTSGNPWGGAPAFSGSGAAEDPFGDAFASKAFAKSAFESDPFSSGPNKENKEATAPPRPAKFPQMSGGLMSDSSHKEPPKLLSEADQLKWAKQESKRAEEERLRKQRQEEADLKLAIALSKQVG